MTELATLKARLNGAFLWLSFLTVAAGIAFLWLVGDVKDVGKDVSAVQSTVSGQAATVNGMHDTLTRIEDKLDGVPDHRRGHAPTK